MSVLKKPYELSLWRDVWNGSKFEEKRFMTIGSDTMNTPLRAMNVQLKRNINGSNDLTFKMYYRCQDTVTGEWLSNPWTDELVNETKLKLHYKNKWYDFIIKDIKEDSSNKCYTYSAIDQHIQELSKNGYDVELDAELMNNTGTATELARSILSGTDWEVDGEVIPQLTEETVVKMVLSKDITCYRLNEETGKPFEVEKTTIGGNKTIYVFYSCCSGAQHRFSFIYLGENAAKVDANGVLTNKNCQYYLDMPSDSYSMGNYGYFVPTFATDNGIHREFRAKKYTFSQKIQYHPVLDKYVYSYSDGETDTEYLGYAETKYITPVLAKNLVTNSLFKSTAGWHGEYIGGAANDKDGSAAKVSVTAKNAAGEELIDNLKSGAFDATETYEPILRLEFQKSNSVVTNSGFYDHRFDIKNLAPGQKFVLLWNGYRGSQPDNLSVSVGVKEYSVSGSQYYKDSNIPENPGSLNKTFLRFNTRSGIIHEILDENATQEEKNKTRVWLYKIGTVSDEYDLTEAVFQKKQTRIFIETTTIPTDENPVKIELIDFQIIPYIATGNENHPFLLPDEVPDSNTTSETTYRIFDKAKNETVKDPKEFVYTYEGKVLPAAYKPFYTEKAEKVTSLSVKQSNYFNSIQSLCEAFECWADFQVEHDPDGYITSKKVYIKNYISKDNYAGLRAGVNLKQTSRGRDSKQIVTKLIVPANSNEHGEDGFCTIARSDYNETGENCIYNFEYYIRQGLLNRDVLYDYFYGTNDEEGYYSALKRCNKNLQALTQEIAVVSTSLVQVKSDLSAAEVGRDQSLELLNDTTDQFQKLTGFSYDTTDETNKEQLKAMVNSSAKVLELLTQISEYRTAYYTYNNQYAKVYALHDKYQDHYNTLLGQFTQTTNEKKELVKDFYGLYGRFLLEGTWKDDKQMDDNLYYLDALSTSNNSNFPQVTYQFSVLDISILPNYEYYDFELGDKTYAEDTEFFGYNKDGTPYREEVVISEVTYNLDDPTANSFQVRNFKNQFQDLFQKITATVQNVSYASGSYDRAASFVEAAADKQAQFLQAAMQDADLLLKNAGQQSVTWGTDGITVTDVDTPSEQVRIVGGAIMLRDPDFGAGERWVTAITAKGINAKVITAGRIDTQLVQIMNGAQPAFRWDYNGITAFDTVFTNQNTVINNSYNPTAGVRFDRFGVYSFRGVNGDTWAPTSVDEILEYAGFALTNEGFSINLEKTLNKYGQYRNINGDIISFSTKVQHSPKVRLGKTEDLIYNAWDDEGKPYYEINDDLIKFVKVLSIKDNKDTETLAIYDNGTIVTNDIRFTGKIEWASNVSFVSEIYHPSSDLPPTLPSDNTSPEDVDNDETNEWTTEYNPALHVYKATSNNGGGKWNGPFLINGKEGPKGDSATIVTAYYLTDVKNFPSQPTTGDIKEEITIYGWSYKKSPNLTSIIPYLFSCQGSKLTTYDANGTETTEIIWGEVKLMAAWRNSDDTMNTDQAYLEYLTLSNFGQTQGLGWADGKLFITATILNVAAEDGKPIFFADAGERNVQIGSFIVDQYGLRGGTSNPAYYGIVGNADKDGIVFYAGATNTTGASPKFSVTNSGILKAIDADIEGTIKATSGRIGGETNYWSINENGLVRENSIALFANGRGIKLNGTSQGYLRIVAGGTSSNWGPENTSRVEVSTICDFAVSSTGFLYAKNAYIAGTISANSGDIGGIEITKSGIEGTNWSLDNDTFTFGGNLTLNFGEGGPDSTTLLRLYGLSTGTAADATGSLGPSDYYLQSGCFFGGEKDWGEMRLLCSSGKSTGLSSWNVQNPISIRIGQFSNPETTENNPYINHELELTSSSLTAYIGLHELGTQYANTFVFRCNQKPKLVDPPTITRTIDFLTITQPGQLSADIAWQINTAGNWYGSWAGGSDYRLKKEITSLQDSYSQFFDNLRPVRFKFYNPSNFQDTYRCGFIAQEVAQALDWAGLTTEEWGGLVTFTQDGDEYYALTYTEFIALNTQQIQLLKPRMTAAEQKIAELETEVSELRAIVSNLTIS